MVVVAPEKVHWEAPGFAGYGEFHGSTMDCSANAELMARHPIDGSPLDAVTLNLWWGEYWNTGHHTSGGATLDHIHWHLTESAHKLDPAKAKVARYIPVDSVSQANLRLALIDALTHSQTVIVYLGNAQALPFNERNVYGHFVALGGIDSDLGYLVGNGDDVNALGGKDVIPARWYSWNLLAAAQVNGLIALEKVGGWPDLGYRQVTLPSAMTWAQIADAYTGSADHAQWLLNWNKDLSSQLWWTVIAGTRVKIPTGQPDPAPAPAPVTPPVDDTTALKAQIVALQAQVADLKQQLATAQANAGDPHAAALVAAIRAIMA